ncbi:MAG: EamA family transporter [Coriobacteriia bacterium]|nr:EamA family transporter [Coriobacteriia bacterium]
MSSSQQQRSVLPLLLLGGAVLFWGTSFVAIKTALDAFSPMTVIWLRMVIASIAFAPFWGRIPRPEYRRGDWKILLLAAMCIPCLYYLFEGFAVQFTTSSQAGVISAIVPLLVAGGAWLFLHERLTWRGGVGIALSLAGVAMLSFGGTVQESASNPLLGNTLELLAMVSAAGSMLATKHLSMRYNPWLITGVQAAVGTVFFAPMALASGPASWLNAPPVAWACVAYLGLAVSLAAFGFYNTALKLMPASRASLAINLIPAVALLAGWAVRGESLSLMQLAACVLIVGAVVFAESGDDPVPVEEPLG